MSTVLLLVALAVESPTPVASPTSPASVAGLPAAQAEIIRRDLRALAQAIGVDPVPEAESKKTMVDVADKALGLASGALGRVAEGLQVIAPEIMRIMIRQQYARAIGDLIAPVFCLLGFLAGAMVLFGKTKKVWAADLVPGKSDSTGALVVACVALWILVVIFAGVTAARLGDSVKRLINPEFYAIRDLVLVLLGRAEG